MGRGVWVCAWVGLVGCQAKDTCEVAAETEPSLALGEGFKSFDALAKGDRLVAESGPQGGQHVWAALRATGLAPGTFNLLGPDPTAPEATVQLVDPRDGSSAGSGTQILVPWKGNAIEAETAAIQVFLNVERPGLVLMQGEAVDRCGTTVTAELEVGF